jgi:hypothetical protein
MPPNRIVALFTPLIALASGALATWLADNVSGLEVSAGQLEAIFLAGLAAVLAPAGQWLYGSQKYERHQEELERRALDADAEAAARASEPDAYYDDDAYDDGYDEDDDYDAAPEAGEYDDDADDYEAALAEDEQPAPLGG